MVDAWMAKLAERDVRTAWGLFVSRYRRLIVATIRRLTQSPDDVREIYAHVCEALVADDLARLRRYAAAASRGPPRDRFSTWLVVVVRNQTIDWLRRRDGRRRLTPSPPALTALQRRIFEHEVIEHRPRVEAYELIRGGAAAPDLPFGAYLREVRATYRALDAAHWRGEPDPAAAAARFAEEVAEPTGGDGPGAAGAEAALGALMASLAPDERLAVQLFVVEERSAAEVARTVGWRNAKSVYNHVYRTLAVLRAGLEQRGLRRDGF